MTDDDMYTCDTCDFYLRINNIYGECRRYPPRDVSIKTDGFGQIMIVEKIPHVTASYWCGEWQCEEDNVCARMIGVSK